MKNPSAFFFSLSVSLLFPCLLLAPLARSEPIMPDTAVIIGHSISGEALPVHNAHSSVRDSHSNIYIAYADSVGVFVKRSSDQGQTWVLLDTLTYPSPFPQYAYPAVSILPGDTLFVAWEEEYYDTNAVWGYGIFVSKYDGSSWSPSRNISYHDPRGEAADNPCLASGPGGYIHCVWQEQNRGVYHAEYHAGVWSPPEFVAAGGLVSFPSLVVDSLGDLHLAYQLYQVSYKKRTSGVWGPSEAVSPSFGAHPSIVVDRLNTPHIVYYAWNDSISLDIFYQYRIGTGWSKPLDISNTTGHSGFDNLSIDSYGHLFAAWEDNTNDTTAGHSEIFYSTYDTQWSLPIAISDSTYPPNYFPNIGLPVTSDGVDVVWQRMLSLYDFQILYRRLPPLPSGAEERSQKAFNVQRLTLNVQSPSRHELNVSYSLPSQSKVSLVLYDLSGRKVMVLDEGEKAAGRYQVRRSLGLPAGVYFLRLVLGREALARKVVVIR